MWSGYNKQQINITAQLLLFTRLPYIFPFAQTVFLGNSQLQPNNRGNQSLNKLTRMGGNPDELSGSAGQGTGWVNRKMKINENVKPWTQNLNFYKTLNIKIFRNSNERKYLGESVSSPVNSGHRETKLSGQKISVYFEIPWNEEGCRFGLFFFLFFFLANMGFISGTIGLAFVYKKS